MTRDDIGYAGVTGRELPGEHWNARILRERAEQATGDDRRQWVFTRPCGHPIGVVTDAHYDYEGAFWEMYGNIREASRAMDDGVTAELMPHAEYVRRYYEQMSAGCTC